MDNTKIEYVDDTANFVTGCLHGCSYCFAKKLATRLSGNEKTSYHLLKRRAGNPFAPAFHVDVYNKLNSRLENVKENRRVLIASMGDIGCRSFFHVVKNGEVLKDEYTNAEVMKFVYELCCKHKRHTFLLLSKWSRSFWPFTWPGNVYIGTSVDSTNHVCCTRIKELDFVDANMKWISIEPLLSPEFEVIDLGHCNLNWVVVGGLSRSKIPNECLKAALRIKEYCNDSKVPLFVKDNLRCQFDSFDWPQELPG
jgi:protein gp37